MPWTTVGLSPAAKPATNAMTRLVRGSIGDYSDGGPFRTCVASLTHLTTPGIGYIGYHLFVEQVFRPTLRQRAIVIVDNRRAHKAVGSREAMAQAGAMAQTLATSTILDARGWFQHCGDAFQ